MNCVPQTRFSLTKTFRLFSRYFRGKGYTDGPACGFGDASRRSRGEGNVRAVRRSRAVGGEPPERAVLEVFPWSCCHRCHCCGGGAGDRSHSNQSFFVVVFATTAAAALPLPPLRSRGWRRSSVVRTRDAQGTERRGLTVCQKYEVCHCLPTVQIM